MNAVNAPPLDSDFSIHFLKDRGKIDNPISEADITALIELIVKDPMHRELHLDILMNIAAGNDATAEYAQSQVLKLYASPEERADGGSLPDHDKSIVRKAITKAASAMCRLALDPAQPLERNLPLPLKVAAIGLHHNENPIDHELNRWTTNFVAQSVRWPNGIPNPDVGVPHLAAAFAVEEEKLKNKELLKDLSEALNSLVTEHLAVPTPKSDQDLKALRVTQSVEQLDCLAKRATHCLHAETETKMGHVPAPYRNVQGLIDAIAKGDGRTRGEAIRFMVASSNGLGREARTMEAALKCVLQDPQTGTPQSDNAVRRFIARAAFEYVCRAADAKSRAPLCLTVAHAANSCDEAYANSFDKKYRTELTAFLGLTHKELPTPVVRREKKFLEQDIEEIRAAECVREEDALILSLPLPSLESQFSAE